MISYSQYGEDQAIVKAVAGVQSKQFLDLGAWHATQFSNTRALIEAGWTGLLVECSPGPARGLIAEYANWPGVKVIVAAVGFDQHCLKIHATDDAVSTSDAATHEKWKTAGGYYGEFWIPQIRLEDIGNQFGGGWEFINFDVEGCSVDVFKRALDLGWRPRCACVEHDDRIVEVNRAATQAGYKQILLNGTNVVFSQ